MKIWNRHKLKTIHILAGGMWIGFTLVLFFAPGAIGTAIAVPIIIASMGSGIWFVCATPKLLMLKWIRLKILFTGSVLIVAVFLHPWPLAVPVINLTLLLMTAIISMRKRNFVIGKHANKNSKDQWKPDTFPIKVPR